MAECKMVSFTPTSCEPTPITNMHTITNVFLPEDIIINILKRLSVKSLKQFQCVCKHWNILIKTPSFIQHHLHHHTHQDPSLLVGPWCIDSVYFLSCDQNMHFRELHIPPFLLSLKRLSLEASSNGLLFLLHRGPHHTYPLLWNPATRHVTKIHSSTGSDSSDTDSDSDSDSDVIFNAWHVTFGFGFSHASNDYKIVRILLCFSEVFEVEVYSVREGFWRRITFDNIEYVRVYGYSVNANGVIFWCGSKYLRGGQVINLIVAFDIVTEVFTVIPLPPVTIDSHQLAVYDEKIAIIFYNISEDSQSFPLYFCVMEEGGVWGSSEKYIGSFGSRLWPMTIWRNQIVYVEFELKNPRHLYLVDVSIDKFELFDIPEFKHGCGFGVDVFNYVESLVPVGGDFQIEEPSCPSISNRFEELNLH